jgi:lysophospholipase L1-like esterase
MLLCAVSQFCRPAGGDLFAWSSSTVVVLGSSTAQGVGASSYQNSWVGLMTTALNGRGYSVRNVSIAGTNTSDSLTRFDHDVASYKPSFVLLATSIINEPAATAVQSYVQNTLLLIRKVESIGAIPILVPLYPNNGYSAAVSSSIRSIYATLAAEGVPMLDFLDGADDGQGHWVQGLSLDGTHPTDIGHRLLFDCIPLTLFDALQRPMPPVNPRGFGSWVQNTGTLAEGDIEIRPFSGMGSWTISFWIEPSTADTERTLLNVNGGWLQLRRTGSELRLWHGSTSLAAGISGPPAFHHVALTYQSITGTLKFYLDGRLRSQALVPGADPATVISFGADAAQPGWNAAGDCFADILLYRAPLSQVDIQAIGTGEPPWKSVEAWLPLGYSPSRPALNLAPSVVTVIVHGSWDWSSDGIPLNRRPRVGTPLAR